MMDYEESESIWKLDGPIGRLGYLKIVFLMLIYAVTFVFASQNQLAPAFAIIFLICALVLVYLNFVATAKRLWDIFNDKKLAIIITVVGSIIGFFVRIPFAGVAILLLLLTVPGSRMD